MNSYRPIANKGPAAVYGRSSTDNQDVGLSTAAQAERTRRHLESLGYTVDDEDIYLEESGISGMTDDRAKFRAMMLKVFSPERLYRAVGVDDIGRLSRSSGDYIDYEIVFAEAGIELVSLMDPPGNPQVKINTPRRMKAVMNEGQVVDSAMKTRSSQMLATEIGFFLAWVHPFGFRKKKVLWRGAEHTKLQPDPETWPHLLHVIDMAKRNETISAMRQYLEATGLKHPAGDINNYRSGGRRGIGKWTNQSVLYLLKHLALLGWTSRGGKNSGTRILHKSEQVICQDAHEAAMTEADRELILRNIASRTREAKSPRTNKSPNPMSGMVVCGVCGATMQMHTENGTQRLICANARRLLKGDLNRCPNPSVRLDILVERTLEAVTGHILTPKVLKRQVELVAKENEKFVAHQGRRKKDIEKRAQKLGKEIGNFMAAIAEYGPSGGAYGREIDKRQDEEKHLRRELEAISSELKYKLAFVNEPDRIVENALNLRTYLNSDDEHSLKEMLTSLIRRVRIIKRIATLEYTIPLPRNGTEEPILWENISVDKKTCPSDGRTGMYLAEPAPQSTYPGHPQGTGMYRLED